MIHLKHKHRIRSYHEIVDQSRTTSTITAKKKFFLIHHSLEVLRRSDLLVRSRFCCWSCTSADRRLAPLPLFLKISAALELAPLLAWPPPPLWLLCRSLTTVVGDPARELLPEEEDPQQTKNTLLWLGTGRKRHSGFITHVQANLTQGGAPIIFPVY